jgi:large subunit ribosomal protein L10
MNKQQKTAVVAELTEELKGSEAIFAIDYRGISVPQAAELRASLREADARFRVVKNRLTLLAADAAGTEELKPHLNGPTALTLVNGDVALAAKTISKLGGEWELLAFKGGLMDGAALDPESFTTIAKLPGRDQLNAQFAGIVASPLTGLVRGLGSMVSGLASQLQQIADQGLVSGEPPAAPPPAEEAPAEEAPAEGAAPSDDAAADEDKPSEEDKPADEATEATAAVESDPDPEPEESPEEAPSQEEAPEGEEAGEPVPQTGEGDADPAAPDETPAEDPAPEGDATTSENSDETKEDE